RDQVQHGLAAVDHQRVAGVVAALEAHDRADVLRQQVDDLALALVAPLGAQNDYRLTHCLPPDTEKAEGAPGFSTLSGFWACRGRVDPSSARGTRRAAGTAAGQGSALQGVTDQGEGDEAGRHLEPADR